MSSVGWRFSSAHSLVWPWSRFVVSAISPHVTSQPRSLQRRRKGRFPTWRTREDEGEEEVEEGEKEAAPLHRCVCSTTAAHRPQKASAQVPHRLAPSSAERGTSFRAGPATSFPVHCCGFRRTGLAAPPPPPPLPWVPLPLLVQLCLLAAPLGLLLLLLLLLPPPPVLPPVLPPLLRCKHCRSRCGHLPWRRGGLKLPLAARSPSAGLQRVEQAPVLLRRRHTGHLASRSRCRPSGAASQAAAQQGPPQLTLLR